MSLYGALFSGVAGLAGQSNKIGTISDNISNVNTVGYKSTEGVFETLVTNSGTIAYSPGGVLGRSRSSVSLQGLLQTTNSNTDIAISGNGFFVVNDLSDGSGTIAYTRAGSFRQDSIGNFQNAAGYYLQGWPLDREGQLPSTTDIDSVETVNVSNVAGAAAATTSIEISANLTASQTQLLGASATADVDSTSGNPNTGVAATDIIVPHSINSLTRGDQFQLTSGNGLSEDLRYGGFSFSKDVTNGTGGDDGIAVPVSPLTLGNNPLSVTNTDQTVTVTHGNHGLATGDVVTISGVTGAIGGVPASDFNQSFVITRVDDDTYTVEVSTAATGTATGGSTGVQSEFREFNGNILDANTTASTFLGTTGTTGYSAEALTFTIQTSVTVSTAVTFTYTSGTPNSALGQFNNMTNLASAINEVTGLSARVANNRLYVSPTDANESITFVNGDVDGGSGAGSSLVRSIDWIGELGFVNTAQGTNRFSSLQNMSDIINNDLSGFSATVNNPSSSSSVEIFVDDPLTTLAITDFPVPTTTIATTFGGAETPITTSLNSRTVTMTHSTTHGFAAGDIITIDPTGMTTYPAATTAVNAFATTNTSGVITISDAGHTFATSDQIFIDMSSVTGYPNGQLNGIPIYEIHGLHTVGTVVAGTSYQITVDSPATATGSTGAGTFLPTPTFGSTGIPLTDMNGSFEVLTTTPTTYTIEVATAATVAATAAATGMVVNNPTNTGSVVTELGLVDDATPLNGATLGTADVQTTGALGPAYVAGTTDMASGAITPQYFTNIRVFDSLGTGHDVRVAFIKSASNVWEAQVYVVPATDVTNVNGLLASGKVRFNGDGSLLSVESELTTAMTPIWTSGAVASSITLDWGTEGIVGVGGTDGMSQFDAAYRLNFANQNGVPVGELIGVEVDTQGTVIARFSNGEEQSLYRIPLADFSNPDGLESNTGNVFIQSRESGTVNLREPGSSGVGTLQSSALESSNVELSEQLTGMIIAQRSYQANTKVITAADDLLEELNRTVG